MSNLNINPQFTIMLYRVPVLLLSFMTHELFHALAAYRCGDMTAKEAGRISFNPIRHIDPFGALMLIFTGFGWAKPVPINPYNFRNKRFGIIITSIAGPFSNILLSTIFYAANVIYTAKARPAPFMPMPEGSVVILTLFYQFYIINIMLAAFNLIPIPPLDGSKALLVFLPERIYYNYILRYERYGMFVIMALSISGYLNMILGPIINAIATAIQTVVQAIAPVFL